LFKEFDRDGSNTIDKDEMFDFVMSLYNDPGEEEPEDQTQDQEAAGNQTIQQ